MKTTLNEMINNPFNQQQINTLKEKILKKNKKTNIFHFICCSSMVLAFFTPIILISYNFFNLTTNNLDILLITSIFICFIFTTIMGFIFDLKYDILTIDNLKFNHISDFKIITLNAENIPATNKQIHKFIKIIQSQNREVLGFEKIIIKEMLKI